MGGPYRGRGARVSVLAAMLAAGALLTPWSPAAGQQSSVFLGPDGAISFTPGLRVQSRFVYDDTDDNQDFFVARVRFKGGGDAFGIAKYYTELKLDNVGRFDRTTTAQIENAWLEFELQPTLALRVGLYDAVFSRDALTSDSKLLPVDRSLIKDALTSVGLADNTVGLLVHGRPLGGRLEYSAGLFDNLTFDGGGGANARQSDDLMVMGRLVFNAFDPAPAGGYADYRGSYVGQGRRLAIGVSTGHLSAAQQGPDEFDLDGRGADVFFNEGPVTLQGEYARYDRDPGGGAPDQVGKGGYAQGGFLATPRVELMARYQYFDPSNFSATDRVQWTAVGANFYIREHNLKVQSDFTVRREQGTQIANNFFQIQLQLDF